MMRATVAVHLSRTLPLVVSAALACSPTEPADFLTARLSPIDEAVTSGTIGHAQVEVTNGGRQSVAVEVNTCPPRVFVSDHRGEGLGQPSVLCTLALVGPVLLAPGETHVYTQGWFASDGRGAPLPTGVYRLRTWVVPVSGNPVLTNRITVTVREP